MKIQATQPITVFIDKGSYNTQLKYTEVGKIPEGRRENVSWKGCNYTIQEGETFKFDRSNNWDSCFFKTEQGAEFKIWCARPESFIERHNAKIIEP